MREAERRDGVGDAARLVGVDRQRLARVDQAEAARPGAAVAEDHERRGAIGPALVDVRATGLLAHRVEVEVAHEPLEPEVLVVEAGAHLHPLGPARRGIDLAADARLGQPPEQPHGNARASPRA